MARIDTAGRIMLIIVSIFLGTIVILVGVLLALSPGRPKPILDGTGKVLAGSISEKTHVPINGVPQGMFIVGRDVDNPVLLFIHGGTAMPEYFLEQKYRRDYTISEKLAIWRGKFFSDKLLWDKMIAVDLTKIIQEVDLPVYFFHGQHDYTVSYPLAQEFLDGLRAPVKGFYTFEESAHSPMFEEPAKMKQIMQEDVLAGANRLADDM